MFNNTNKSVEALQIIRIVHRSNWMLNYKILTPFSLPRSTRPYSLTSLTYIEFIWKEIYEEMVFLTYFCTSTNVSSYLSRLSGKQTFPVSWAEENDRLTLVSGMWGSLILISRNTDIFNCLNIYRSWIIESWATVGRLHKWFRNCWIFTCNHAGIP